MITRGEDVRARDRALLHQLAQADIQVIRHARTAHGRDARFERRARGTEVRDVRVCVDESRNDVTAADVDHRHAGRRGCGSDGHDLAIPEDDGGFGNDRAVTNVDDVGVDESRGLLRRKRSALSREECGRDQDQRHADDTEDCAHLENLRMRSLSGYGPVHSILDSFQLVIEDQEVCCDGLRAQLTQHRRQLTSMIGRMIDNMVHLLPQRILRSSPVPEPVTTE